MRAETSPVARLAIAGLTALLLSPAISVRPALTAAPPLPTFGNPTISGIQGFGFEQDLRLDTHGRVYTSVPGSLGSNISYAWRSLDGGQTFKWIPAAAQPAAGTGSAAERARHHACPGSGSMRTIASLPTMWGVIGRIGPRYSPTAEVWGTLVGS